jgi:hypothetical protein
METQKDTQSRIARKVNFAIQPSPRNSGLAGNVAQIDVQREALALSAPKQCRAIAMSSASQNRHLTLPVLSCLKRGGAKPHVELVRLVRAARYGRSPTSR